MNPSYFPSQAVSMSDTSHSAIFATSKKAWLKQQLPICVTFAAGNGGCALLRQLGIKIRQRDLSKKICKKLHSESN